jgi:hypothetical protein
MKRIARTVVSLRAKLGAGALLTVCSLVGISLGAGVQAQRPVMLTRPTAAALIQKSDWMSQIETYTFSEGKQCVAKTDISSPYRGYTNGWMSLISLSTTPMAGTAADFYSIRELGPKDWTSDADYFRDQTRCSPMLGVWVVVTLLPKGEAAAKSKHWARNGTTHTLTIASKSFIDVTGISGGDQLQVAEFSWHWNPTPVGETFDGPHGNGNRRGGYGAEFPHKSTATFKRYDDGWRLTAIE